MNSCVIVKDLVDKLKIKNVEDWKGYFKPIFGQKTV